MWDKWRRVAVFSKALQTRTLDGQHEVDGNRLSGMNLSSAALLGLGRAQDSKFSRYFFFSQIRSKFRVWEWLCAEYSVVITLMS